MTTDEIRARLFELKDDKYAAFHRKLIPTVNPDKVLGVRTPALRKFAKEVARDGEGCAAFLQELPHRYYDENQLHAFIISGIKDYESCVFEVEKFLPYVDNWATCDQMLPAVFKKNKDKLVKKIYEWLDSDKTYTVRFGIGMLMKHYLEEDFKPEYLERVSVIRSDEYYIQMMIAWYFATALSFRYDDALPYIRDNKLDPDVKKKTVRKAIESYRISKEQKDYLRNC